MIPPRRAQLHSRYHAGGQGQPIFKTTKHDNLLNSDKVGTRSSQEVQSLVQNQQGTWPDTGIPQGHLKDVSLSFSAVCKQRAGGPHEAPSHTALFPAA